MDAVSIELKQLRDDIKLIRDALVNQRKNRVESLLVSAALSGLCASMPGAKNEEIVSKAIEIGSAAASSFNKKFR
jgi:hypothetical protein